MSVRNGRTVATWIAVALMVVGIVAGVVLSYADNHHTAAQAQITAEKAHGRIDRLELIVREIDKKAARILGILEREGESK